MLFVFVVMFWILSHVLNLICVLTCCCGFCFCSCVLDLLQCVDLLMRFRFSAAFSLCCRVFSVVLLCFYLLLLLCFLIFSCVCV